MKQVAIEDLYQYRFPSNLKWAPGGGRAAFVVSTCNQEENRYNKNIWILDEQGERRLTGMDEESSYCWEDPFHLLFSAVRSVKDRQLAEQNLGYTSYYRIDVRGGEAVFAFCLPAVCGELYLLGNNKYAAIGTTRIDLPDLYLCNEDQRREVLAAAKEDEDYEVLEKLPYWFDGEGHISNIRRSLYLWDAQTGCMQRMTDMDLHITSVVVDHGKLFFSAFHFGENLMDERMGLYSLEIPESGEASVHCLVAPRQYVFEGIGTGFGHVIIKGDEVSQRTGKFLLINPVTGQITKQLSCSRCMGNTVNSDSNMGGGYTLRYHDNLLYYICTVDNGSAVYTMDANGQERMLTDAEGAVFSLDVNERGDVLAVGQYDMKLPEIYCIKNGQPQQVTHLNTAALEDKYVAIPEKVTFHSQDWDLDGWALKPIGYDPQKTYPAILNIHGGPKTVYGEVFHHEMQTWASLGYFVLFCNPLGSDGRGDEFAFSLVGDNFQKSFYNLMDFVDVMLKKYPQIDPNRVAVTGGSYGGYMTNWIIGHTNRFVCAATQRSIANQITMETMADWGWLSNEKTNERNDGSSLLRDVDRAWDRSPLKYAKSFKTPTLILHSDCDFRCPISEGYQMFYALKQMGVPTKMVVFKGEGHSLSRTGKPRHRVRRLQEITNWVDHYTKR